MVPIVPDPWGSDSIKDSQDDKRKKQPKEDVTNTNKEIPKEKGCGPFPPEPW